MSFHGRFTPAATTIALACMVTLGTPALRAQELPNYNVILYVLDTTRADHFGLYGYERNTTPFMDAIAEEGVFWTHPRSSSIWTWPAVVSMWTGMTAQTHKSLEASLSVHPGWDTLSEVLGENGYSTHFVTSNGVLYPVPLSDGLFDQVILTDRPDQNLTDALVSIVESPGERPFFIHAQPYAAHTPYIPPAPYDSLFIDDEFYGHLGDVPRINPGNDCIDGIKHYAAIDSILSMDWYVSQYDGLIAYMDDQVRQLFDTLEEQGLRENTLVIITADHGEELTGEHGRYFCHWDHYEGNIHVPLLLIPPGAFQAEHGPFEDIEVAGHPEHIDLMPTILEMLDVPFAGTLQGRNLLVTPNPRGSISFSNVGSSMQKGNLKLIDRNPTIQNVYGLELYDLDADPGETINLAIDNPDLAMAEEAKLNQVYRTFNQVTPAPEPPGTLFESDLEDTLQTDEWFLLSKVDPLIRWTFVTIEEDSVENRVLHGIVSHNDPNVPLNYRIMSRIVGPPRGAYAAEAMVRLLSGEVVVSICWSEWMYQGYRVVFGEDSFKVIRQTKGVPAVESAPIPFDFGTVDWRKVRVQTDGRFLEVFVDDVQVFSARERNAGEIWGSTVFAIPSTGGEAVVDDIRIFH